MGRGGTYVLLLVCDITASIFDAGREATKGGAEVKLVSADEWGGISSAADSNGTSGGGVSLWICGAMLFGATASQDFEST